MNDDRRSIIRFLWYVANDDDVEQTRWNVASRFSIPIPKCTNKWTNKTELNGLPSLLFTNFSNDVFWKLRNQLRCHSSLSIHFITYAVIFLATIAIK